MSTTPGCTCEAFGYKRHWVLPIELARRTHKQVIDTVLMLMESHFDSDIPADLHPKVYRNLSMDPKGSFVVGVDQFTSRIVSRREVEAALAKGVSPCIFLTQGDVKYMEKKAEKQS